MSAVRSHSYGWVCLGTCPKKAKNLMIPVLPGLHACLFFFFLCTYADVTCVLICPSVQSAVSSRRGPSSGTGWPISCTVCRETCPPERVSLVTIAWRRRGVSGMLRRIPWSSAWRGWCSGCSSRRFCTQRKAVLTRGEIFLRRGTSATTVLLFLPCAIFPPPVVYSQK